MTDLLQGEPPKIPIAVGDSVEVYHFDMSRKIRMTVQMDVRPASRLMLCLQACMRSPGAPHTAYHAFLPCTCSACQPAHCTLMPCICIA